MWAFACSFSGDKVWAVRLVTQCGFGETDGGSTPTPTTEAGRAQSSGARGWMVTRLGFRESPMGALHPSSNNEAGGARSGLYTKRTRRDCGGVLSIGQVFLRFILIGAASRKWESLIEDARKVFLLVKLRARGQSLNWVSGRA